MTKQCAKCGKVKSLSEFNARRKSADGRQHWCRECLREYLRERREAGKIDDVKAVLRDLSTGSAVGGQGAEFLEFRCVRCGKPFRRYMSAVESDYRRRGIIPKFCTARCRQIYHLYPESEGYGAGWEEFDQLQDAEWLRRQYHHEGLKLWEIAGIVGCSASQVGQAMQVHEIPTIREMSPRKLRLMRAVERQREVAKRCK